MCVHLVEYLLVGEHLAVWRFQPTHVHHSFYNTLSWYSKEGEVVHKLDTLTSFC